MIPTPITTLVTHPGGAHKDEFLACCVLLAETGGDTTLFRREPTAADLADAAIAVIDVGHRHEPERHNFDHHQLPRDGVPTCALSLVLQHLGIYEDAREFCDWLEPVEWFDCRGPNDTARWLGVDREIVNRLYSPIDGTLLRRFAQAACIEPTDTLGEVMRWIGRDLLDYVRGLRRRLNALAEQTERWTVGAGDSEAEVVFLARTEPLPDDPSGGLDRFVSSQPWGERVLGYVTPDRRSGGYGLSRHRDNLRLDFTRIADEPDVHFAHARGFVAKTSASDPARLRELLHKALV
mgnify:CR=1 FL=1